MTTRNIRPLNIKGYKKVAISSFVEDVHQNNVTFVQLVINRIYTDET